MSERELSSLLWEERQLLDLLLFKLEEESLLLASGRHHWLHKATSEVEFVLGRIQEMERSREAVVAELGTRYGLGESPSLEQLADCVPEPWAGTFRDHRKALQVVVDRTQEVARRNKEVLARYVMAVSDALAIVGVSGGGASGPAYAADGSLRSPTERVRLVDARS